MKPGDLVRHAPTRNGKKLVSTSVGLIVEMTNKKCWRSDEFGPLVDWRKIDPEPHAVVLYAHNDGTIDIPIVELEVVDESR